MTEFGMVTQKQISAESSSTHPKGSGLQHPPNFLGISAYAETAWPSAVKLGTITRGGGSTCVTHTITCISGDQPCPVPRGSGPVAPRIFWTLLHSPRGFDIQRRNL